jgi:hypothetical protein
VLAEIALDTCHARVAVYTCELKLGSGRRWVWTINSGRETMSEEQQSNQEHQAKDDAVDVKAILVMFTAAVLFAAVYISGFTVDL